MRKRRNRIEIQNKPETENLSGGWTIGGNQLQVEIVNRNITFVKNG